MLDFLEDIFTEPLTYLVIIGLAWLIWFPYILFHYSHKYKVETKKRTVSMLFSDNKFDVGDKIVVSNTDNGEYREFSRNYSSPPDTVIITKILR